MNFSDYYPQLAHFIAGEWRKTETNHAIKVINPANEQELAALPMATAQDINDALESSSKAYSAWRLVPVTQRAVYLKKAAELLRQRASAIGYIITLEQGRPYQEGVDEVLRAADLIEWNAQAAIELLEHNDVSSADLTQDGAAFIRLREPIGPVAAFTPWNVPVLSPARKISMALAAGCTCILKPAENTPGAAVEVVRAFADAGLPAGVLNLLTGDPGFISGHLVESWVIRKITFTGSVPIGKLLAQQAGALMKPVTMELGGHNPVLIMDDVEVEQVAKLTAQSAFRNAGQICTSPTRVYVHQAIYADFVSALKKATEAITLGDGLDENTVMGPVANARRIQEISQLVEQSVDQGATLVTGGQPHSPGYFYEPTVLTDVPAVSAFMQQEPFGPVVAVFAFTDLEQGVAACNDSSLGLASYVFAKNVVMARQIAAQLETGVVGINQYSVSRPAVPFGGVKDSGYGREGGVEGLSAFLITKTLV